MAPAQSRLPLPWELVCALAMVLASRGLLWEARLVVFIVIFYLRPSEAFRLKGRNRVAPMPEAGPSHAHWAVILHEFIGEDSQPSKTDESLLLDLPEHEYLSGVLREWRRDTPPDEKLVPFAQSHLARAFRLSGMILGLDPPPMLYQLRHSGPSADFAGGRRSLDSIKRRGRWPTDASVRRYEKGGRVTDQLGRLKPLVRGYAVASAKLLPAVLLRRLGPLRFPVS